MSVELILKKMVCIDVFPHTSDVHSCLFHAITSKEEEIIDSRAAWTEALRSVMTH